jgi:hypothetical protein
MPNTRLAVQTSVATVVLLIVNSLASAQATRTWVSGVGDDANPCSRTAPCKTFAGAISKTADGGEINCIDAPRFWPPRRMPSWLMTRHHLPSPK